jgi:hypothetical protein
MKTRTWAALGVTLSAVIFSGTFAAASNLIYPIMPESNGMEIWGGQTIACSIDFTPNGACNSSTADTCTLSVPPPAGCGVYTCGQVNCSATGQYSNGGPFLNLQITNTPTTCNASTEYRDCYKNLIGGKCNCKNLQNLPCTPDINNTTNCGSSS